MGGHENSKNSAKSLSPREVDTWQSQFAQPLFSYSAFTSQRHSLLSTRAQTRLVSNKRSGCRSSSPFFVDVHIRVTGSLSAAHTTTHAAHTSSKRSLSSLFFLR